MRTIERAAGSATICIKGSFTIDASEQFQAHAHEVLASTPGSEVCVDLAEVEHIDCAALGLLLLLRDRARAQGKTVALAGARGRVSQTLAAANFPKLFAIA